MSSVTIERLTESLEEYVRGTGASIDILLVGGLALQAYGYSDRVTVDMDGEMVGDPEPLVTFLRARQIPADLGEDFSRWSVIAMPPGFGRSSRRSVDDVGKTHDGLNGPPFRFQNAPDCTVRAVSPDLSRE